MVICCCRVWLRLRLRRLKGLMNNIIECIIVAVAIAVAVVVAVVAIIVVVVVVVVMVLLLLLLLVAVTVLARFVSLMFLMIELQ